MPATIHWKVRNGQRESYYGLEVINTVRYYKRNFAKTITEIKLSELRIASGRDVGKMCLVRKSRSNMKSLSKMTL